METGKATPPKTSWTAAELRKLPAKQRDTILKVAAAAAESCYRTDRALTDFEAFGPDDLHGDSTATPSG